MIINKAAKEDLPAILDIKENVSGSSRTVQSEMIELLFLLGFSV
jgi:hypothetical protein